MTRRLRDDQIEALSHAWFATERFQGDGRTLVEAMLDAEAALWQAEIAAEQDCCTQQAVEAVGYKAEIDKLKEREKRLIGRFLTRFEEASDV